MEPFVLPDDLADEVLERLGVSVPTDLAGVDRLYAAWCAAVPFDAPAKALARMEGRRPPGDDPEAVCRLWLDTGIGATCWGHIAGLAALLRRGGVATSVGLDRMLRDDLVDFHGFLVVHDGRRRWSVDPVHVSGAALPVEAGARGVHPVYRTGLDLDGDDLGAERLIHWFAHPADGGAVVRYTLLSTAGDRADVAALCAVSATFTGVGARRLFHRRSLPDAIVGARPDPDGHLLVRTHRSGDGPAGVVTDAEVVTDLDEALVRLGYTPAALPVLERSGLLARDAGGTFGWVGGTT